MANYDETTLTNMFRVTDPKRLKEILDNCSAEFDIDFWKSAEEDGTEYFGFGCYGSISGMWHESKDGDDCVNYADDDPDIDLMYAEIQKILPDGEFCVITSIGNEKLRYIGARACIITNKEIKYIDLETVVNKEMKEMKGA